MIVVDASTLIDLLLRAEQAPAIERRLFAPGETWHAPHLLDVEVAQVLRRFVAQDRISEQRGYEALTDLHDLPLHRHAHGFLLPRAWELRRNLTAYDGVYLALAEALDAPLLTRDRRLANAVDDATRVEVI